MRRMRRTATVTIAVATLCAIGAIVREPTAASWTDTEQASGSLTSGTVQPVTGLRCTGSGIAQPVTLAWSAPTARVSLRTPGFEALTLTPHPCFRAKADLCFGRIIESFPGGAAGGVVLAASADLPVLSQVTRPPFSVKAMPRIVALSRPTALAGTSRRIHLPVSGSAPA